MLIVLLSGFAVGSAAGVMPGVGAVDAWSDAAGAFKPLIVVAVITLLLVALVPRSVLAAGSGLLFGVWTGACYVMTGALLSALLAFALGRWLGRAFVDTRRHAVAMNAWLDRRGLVGVLVLRLLPIAPYGLISYVFGTTRLRVTTFMAATLLGVAPSTLVFATLGANAFAPNKPAFVVATAAALLLVVGGAVGAALLRRWDVAKRRLTDDES